MFEETLETKRIIARTLRGEQRGPPRVFVAEADDARRDLICVTLRLDGHEVVPASDGAKLVTALVESLTGDPPRAPDLIVMEARLPHWSGLNILQRLRRFDTLTPVILLAGESDRPLVDEALRLGVSGVLEDPFDFAQLRRVAHEALDGGAFVSDKGRR